MALRIFTVLCPFSSFPLEKESKNDRQFVEMLLKFKLLKFKNIATGELVLDRIMRKLGLSVYFLSKKKKKKRVENNPTGLGKSHLKYERQTFFTRKWH